MTPDKSLHEIEHEAWSQRAEIYDSLFGSISKQAIGDILDSLGKIEGEKHLDVACGTGHLVAAASLRGVASEGIDFAEPMIEVARKTYPGNLFKVADATQLPYEHCSFGAVTCAFGLSHVEKPQVAVDEVFRVLKPGGYFAFTLWFDGENGNELFRIMNDAVTRFEIEVFALPVTWKRMRFADEQICESVTRQSGFDTLHFKRLPILWQTTSAGQIVDILEKISVRSKMVIEHQSPAIQQQILEYILSEIDDRRVDGNIKLTWPALLTVVQKPGQKAKDYEPRI
jgi:ubiquinone/menaquinone biosynthesis C-methylase UbiE